MYTSQLVARDIDYHISCICKIYKQPMHNAIMINENSSKIALVINVYMYYKYYSLIDSVHENVRLNYQSIGLIYEDY